MEQTLARRIEPHIYFNGVEVTKDVAGCLTDISYTDPADGESDSVSLGFSDRERKWLTAWFPEKTDKLEVKVILRRWESEEEGDRLLNCGSFILDSFSFSGDPVEVKLSGVSSPVDGGFKATKRTKTWEKVTVKEIAGDIAKRAGIGLTYDAEDVTISKIEQSNQDDSSFLKGLCDDYNLSLKVYRDKLIIFDREEYKKKEPVHEFNNQEIESWDWQTDIQGSYTGAHMTYTVPKSSKKIEYTTGTKDRMLEVTGEVTSAAEAEKKCKAALAKANHDITQMSITAKGRNDIYAGQTVTVRYIITDPETGTETESNISGKYYVDSVSHQISGGYKSSYKLSLVGPFARKIQ